MWPALPTAAWPRLRALLCCPLQDEEDYDEWAEGWDKKEDFESFKRALRVGPILPANLAAGDEESGSYAEAECAWLEDVMRARKDQRWVHLCGTLPQMLLNRSAWPRLALHVGAWVQKDLPGSPAGLLARCWWLPTLLSLYSITWLCTVDDFPGKQGVEGTGEGAFALLQGSDGRAAVRSLHVRIPMPAHPSSDAPPTPPPTPAEWVIGGSDSFYYGNYPLTFAEFYCALAIVARVPPFVDRPAAPHAMGWAGASYTVAGAAGGSDAAAGSSPTGSPQAKCAKHSAEGSE